jgi:hypothetical protein
LPYPAGASGIRRHCNLRVENGMIIIAIRFIAIIVADLLSGKVKFMIRLLEGGVLFCHLLMVTVIILITRFFSKKGITGSKYFLVFSFSIGYLFLLIYSKRVFTYYNNSLRRVEELLKDLAV